MIEVEDDELGKGRNGQRQLLSGPESNGPESIK